MNFKAKCLRILSFAFLSTIVVSLTTSCFSLGGKRKNDVDEHDFDNYYADYLDSIDDIHFINQQKINTSFNYKDSFFNKECVDEMRTWIKNPNCVPFDEYAYMSFKINKDMDISSISMYIRGQNIVDSVEVEIYLFKASSFDLAGNFATYDIWDNELKYQTENPDEDKKSLFDFDDLNVKNALAVRKMSLSESWDSFSFIFFEKGEADATTPYKAYEDDRFVLMIKNNMGIGRADNMTKVSFSATSLLVAMPEEE